jgi:hypothetical protein
MRSSLQFGTWIAAIWLPALAPLSSGAGTLHSHLGLVAVSAGIAQSNDDGRGSPYILEKADNICGLDDAKQLSNPVKVDYDALLEVTPQIKQMKRDKIDPNSAKGIQLRTEAEALVRDSCEKIRADKSYCSVWKKIERRDGGKITDITDKVKKQITGEK